MVERDRGDMQRTQTSQMAVLDKNDIFSDTLLKAVSVILGGVLRQYHRLASQYPPYAL
jgi:hypothetical protein